MDATNPTVVLSRHLSEETAKVGKNQHLYSRRMRVTRYISDWEFYVLGLFDRARTDETRLAMALAAIEALSRNLRTVCAAADVTEDLINDAVVGFIADERRKAELAMEGKGEQYVDT